MTAKFIYWQDDDAWLGYLVEFPDCWTQGSTYDDLVEHLKDLYADLTTGVIPGVRRQGELIVS
jgi:predicted RNase H-like HicB family nuclease